MRLRASLTCSLLALLATAGARGQPEPTLRVFATPVDALASLMATRPRVVAFGEFHEIKGGAKVPSAIKRYTDQLFPSLQARASDLIVETWVTEGNCGKKEEQVVKDVATTTKRPESTESEVVTLIKRAKAASVQPHILDLSCIEYQSLLLADGGVDYEKMLDLITRKLREQIEAALKARVLAPDKVVMVYGGALHNDVFPREELRPYTFAEPVSSAVGGRYLEVDLYVPEFVEHDATLQKEAWFPLWKKQQKPGKTILVERGPRSYIIVFARARR